MAMQQGLRRSCPAQPGIAMPAKRAFALTLLATSLLLSCAETGRVGTARENGSAGENAVLSGPLHTEAGVLTLPADHSFDRVRTIQGPWEIVVSGDGPTERLHVPPGYGRYFSNDGSRFVSGPISYRLTVENVPSDLRTAIRFPTRARDVAVTVNGTNVASSDLYRVGAGIVVPLHPDEDGIAAVELRIDASHRPGSLSSFKAPRIGTVYAILETDDRRSLANGMIVGAILATAAFFTFIRLGPRSGMSNPALALSALMVVVVLRILLIDGDISIASLLPIAESGITLRLRSLAIYPIAALLIHVVDRMFPGENQIIPRRLIPSLSWLWLVASILLPIQWWNDLLYLWTPVALLTIASVFVTARRAVRAQRTGARFVLAGLLVLVLGGVLEVVRVFRWIPGATSALPLTWLLFTQLLSGAVTVRTFRFRISLSRLRDQAQHDGLTGLYNRRSLDHRLNEEWDRHLRSSSSLAFLMLDIDHFKQYNDTQGHQAGDQVIKAVAAIMDEHAQRATDFVARYGGEEFAMVLPNTDAQGAYLMAQRLRESIRAGAIAHPESPSGVITVSVGVASSAAGATAPRSGDGVSGPERLVRAADAAMYEAKRAGRDAVRSGSLD